MASNILTPEARPENIKALALAAGITPEQAAARLDGRVLCTSTAVMLPPASSIKNCAPCWQGRLTFTARLMADPIWWKWSSVMCSL